MDRGLRQTVAIVFALSVVLGSAACGDDDSSGTPDDTWASDTNEDGDNTGGSAETVALSSLDIDLPDDFVYDPPVPADASLDDFVEREAGDATVAGYDLFLATDATFDDLQATYDTYMDGMELTTATPDSQAWSGRQEEGGPAITIAFIGGRLNIAQINDQG